MWIAGDRRSTAGGCFSCPANIRPQRAVVHKQDSPSPRLRCPPPSRNPSLKKIDAVPICAVLNQDSHFRHANAISDRSFLALPDHFIRLANPVLEGPCGQKQDAKFGHGTLVRRAAGPETIRRPPKDQRARPRICQAQRCAEPKSSGGRRVPPDRKSVV